MAATHYATTGLPAYATATVFLKDTNKPTLAPIYSDAGLTTPARNPFALVNGAYDFYANSLLSIYVAIGVGRAIYERTEDSALLPHTFEEYAAPQVPPKPAYTVTNLTVLRGGDFSALVAADVRSVLGTLIQDLRELGVLK